MADNRHLYGLRWHGNLEGGCCPKALDFVVASAQTFSAGGAVDLNIGDPVQIQSDGSVTLAAIPAGGTPGTLFGVVSSVLNAKVDANGYSRPASFLPSGTTYATEPLRSRVAVIPFGRNVWEVDCNDNTTATTINAYRALINENVAGVFSRDVTNPNRPKANPLLNISTHAVTATFDFRIVGVSNTADNFDFTGNFVKLLVVVNNTTEAPFQRTGIL